MSDKIKCPFCQAGYMDKVVPVYSDSYVLIGCQTKCNTCDASGPMGYGDTYKECENEAIRLGSMRSQPLNRVLTLDDIRNIENEKDGVWPFDSPPYLWFERNDGCMQWVSWSDILFILAPNREIFKLNAECYGEKWRCWLHKPTDEERAAVLWED